MQAVIKFALCLLANIQILFCSLTKCQSKEIVGVVSVCMIDAWCDKESYRDLSGPWFWWGLPRSPPLTCAGPPSFLLATRFLALFFFSSLVLAAVVSSSL